MQNCMQNPKNVTACRFVEFEASYGKSVYKNGSRQKLHYTISQLNFAEFCPEFGACQSCVFLSTSAESFSLYSLPRYCLLTMLWSTSDFWASTECLPQQGFDFTHFLMELAENCRVYAELHAESEKRYRLSIR